MSLTQQATVYGAVHESALNDILTVLFTARPRYVKYGSPPFASPATPDVTPMQPIQLPGIGDVGWSVVFANPHVDLGQGTVQLTASVELTVQLPSGPKVIDLDVIAAAHAEVVANVISFRLDSLELVDITPDGLESLLEDVIKALLGGFLAHVQIPLQNLLPPGVPLQLAQGPVIADDQIKIYANVT